ncbi:hypothetical protein C0Q70_12249 [Pomacea canaliculata]|uniref:Reverse transcriptase domain-containing protein n=1 Tax=Pomacea canaliculata TaxID=400727 RepID=A0A2T7P0Z8_POMCA|nr:hypothetical protein C0Q70_12249 [Pomacea canaliculata]
MRQLSNHPLDSDEQSKVLLKMLSAASRRQLMRSWSEEHAGFRHRPQHDGTNLQHKVYDRKAPSASRSPPRRCLPGPSTLPRAVNIFLEKIMRNSLAEHQTSVSIGGRPISNLRFADDIDLMAGSNSGLQSLTDKLDACSKAYGMEISTEKSKVLVTATIGTESGDAR